MKAASTLQNAKDTRHSTARRVANESQAAFLNVSKFSNFVGMISSSISRLHDECCREEAGGQPPHRHRPEAKCGARSWGSGQSTITSSDGSPGLLFLTARLSHCAFSVLPAQPLIARSITSISNWRNCLM